MELKREMQWDENQYGELTGQLHPDITRYLDTRHLPAPKSSAQLPVQATKPAPVVTLDMKRYFVAGGATTFFVAVIAAAEQGAFTAAAAFGGYIVAVGGGIGFAWVILRACFMWSPAKSAPAPGGGGVPPNDGGKYEYYQEQRQGWRKF